MSFYGTPEQVISAVEKDGDQMVAAMMISMLDYERQYHERFGETGWDAPSRLLICFRLLPPPEVADQLAQLGTAAAVIGMSDLNIARLRVNFDGGPDMTTFLVGLAALLRTDNVEEQFTALLGSDLRTEGWSVLGWVMQVEGWGVEGDDAEEVMRSRVSIAEHPRRVEYRIVQGVDRVGYRYQLTRVRQTNKLGAIIDTRDEQESGLAVSGPMSDALAEVMEATPEGI